MKTSQVKNVLYGVSLLAVTVAPQAQARKHTGQHMMGQKATGHSKKRVQDRPIEIEAWPGQRVMLVMPLALGANWNSDPALGRALLLDGESNLQRALLQTNKLSLLQLQPKNPIFQRAVQDKVVTDAELADWTSAEATTPLLERARAAVGKLQPSFEQPALIGDFAIEEIRSSGEPGRTSVQVQVSGRMYGNGAGGLANPTPGNFVVTSKPVLTGRDTLKALHLAANNAFQQVAAQMTSPIEITNLPTGGGGTVPITGGSTTPAASGPATTAPTIPVPDTPAPATPAPGTPAGTESPAPVTPAPATPATPATPEVPAPATPPAAAPESPAPATPAPTAPAIQQQ